MKVKVIGGGDSLSSKQSLLVIKMENGAYIFADRLPLYAQALRLDIFFGLKIDNILQK